MNDTEKLREIASSIIGNSNDDRELKNAAELLSLASEIEKQRAEARKLAVEEQKLSFDLGNSQQRLRSEDVKTYISSLSPLFTTIVLAGTLMLQSYQFLKSEKDKQVEASRQAEAAEDVRWSDAVKLLSQSDKLSPAGAVLKGFVKSTRYGIQAHQTAVQILLKTDDPKVFENLFVSVFDPVDWNNLTQVVDLNRTLESSFGPLSAKTWNDKKQVSDMAKLDISERHTYTYLQAELKFTTAKIASGLKGPRRNGVVIDLRSTDLWNGDFRGADLSGANLDNATFLNVDVKGADMSGITHYENLDLFGSAWWEASKVSQGFLEYLIKRNAFQPEKSYGSGGSVSRAEYDAEIARLKHGEH